MHEAILQSRQNPAAVRPDRAARQAYGPFCDEVRRLKLSVLTATEKDLAWLLGKLTLAQGFTSLAFSAEAELTRLRSPRGGDARWDLARPFAGLGRNDLNPGLKVLAGLGMILIEEKRGLEAGVPPVSLLTLFADASHWTVPVDGWRFALDEERELVEASLARRRQWTAILPELAPEADLHDARAALAASVSPGARTVRADARIQWPESPATRCVGASGAVARKDARPVATRARDVAGESVCSGLRNTERPANGGVCPASGTSRASDNREQKKQLTVQPLNSYSRVNEVNRLLAELKVQFVRAHGQQAADDEMLNWGGAWRQLANARPDWLEAETAALRGHIDEGKPFSRSAWHFVRYYICQKVGEKTWGAARPKIFKESFNKS